MFFFPVEIITQESGSGTLRAIGAKGGQEKKNKTKGIPVGKFKRIFYLAAAGKEIIGRQQRKFNCAACKMGGLVVLSGWYSLFRMK